LEGRHTKGQTVTQRPIEEIREAFYRIHQYATGQTRTSYMSIPVNPKRDADFILSDAIDELSSLRSVLRTVTEALDEAIELSADIYSQAPSWYRFKFGPSDEETMAGLRLILSSARTHVPGEEGGDS
jgi:hypothetical protein